MSASDKATQIKVSSIADQVREALLKWEELNTSDRESQITEQIRVLQAEQRDLMNRKQTITAELSLAWGQHTPERRCKHATIVGRTHSVSFLGNTTPYICPIEGGEAK